MLELDARGHYTVGKELIDQVLDKIRRVAGQSTSDPFNSWEQFTYSYQTTALVCKVSSSSTPLVVVLVLGLVPC